jgi:hypothetical protein
LEPSSWLSSEWRGRFCQQYVQDLISGALSWLCKRHFTSQFHNSSMLLARILSLHNLHLQPAARYLLLLTLQYIYTYDFQKGMAIF